jgi:hypothetical protein
MVFSSNTPDRNAVVSDLTNTTPNSATFINNQVQAILNRMQYNYNLVQQISAQQSILIQQYQATGAGTIPPLLTQIAQETAGLNQQNLALFDRLNVILPNLSNIETLITGLTSDSNSIETKGSVRRIDVNYQRQDPDLVAIAALSPTPNTVIQTNASSILNLVSPPNFGALPPSVYRSGWSPAAGQNSGFTASQANTWIVLPMALLSAGTGYTHSGSRAIVTAGTYEIFAQCEGVGCVEFMCRLVRFVGAAVDLVCNGNTAFTVLSGGSLGQSFAIKSYIKNTLVLPACELELQYKFKTPHASAGLSGGMAVSTPSLPEDFAFLTLTRIA